VYFFAAAFLVVIDQISKWAVVTYMELNENIPVIGEFFAIYSHRNRGAAFGILQNQRWLFIAVTVVFVAGVVWLMVRTLRSGKRQRLFMSGLTLLLGGAIGNFIDRVTTGEVVDFLKFHFEFSLFGLDVDYTYPIFNVADIGVVVGALLLILDTLINGRESKKEITA
jgi:signal peptidase II